MFPENHQCHTAEGMTYDEIAADEEFCKLLASMKYLRVNFSPMTAQRALYETLCQPLSLFGNYWMYKETAS